jgi:DnaD/phage-associated family protein
MSTFRVVKDTENPYVMINKGFIYDETLSYKAKGILLYIFSRPDDWQIYEKEIVKHAKDSKDSVATGIKELLKAGYMSREKRREQGRFNGYDYEVYEVPRRSGFSDAVNPKTENPKTENPLILNKEGTKELNNSTPTKENAFRFYGDNFGMLTPHLSDKLANWLDDFEGEDSILIKAMEIALERNKRNWGYCEAILKDWYSNKVKSLADIDSLEAEKQTKPKAKRTGKAKRNQIVDEGELNLD